VTNGGAPCALFVRVDERGHDAGTTRAQRVADGDGTTVDIGLGQISPAICSPIKREGSTTAMRQAAWSLARSAGSTA
jgi:hypothetical protein